MSINSTVSISKEEENGKEISREAAREKTSQPPHHSTVGDGIPISRGESQISVRLDNTETLPINMFPKYYVRRKNKLPERITQTQQLPALEEEVTPQQDDPY